MNEVHASFWEHLDELRTVLIRSFLAIFCTFLIALYFSDALISALPHTELFLFSPVEGFIAVFRLCFWLAILGASPYWLWALIRFLMPALKAEEQNSLPLFFFLSLIFILCGLYICHAITLPIANQYLMSFNALYGQNLWGFGAYLDFVLMLFFAHGAVFEMGALLLFLVHQGIIRSSALAEKRRHAIVGSLIIGALLTPPDILTQICLAVPLFAFYELAIFYGKTKSFIK